MKRARLLARRAQNTQCVGGTQARGSWALRESRVKKLWSIPRMAPRREVVAAKIRLDYPRLSRDILEVKAES